MSEKHYVYEDYITQLQDTSEDLSKLHILIYSAQMMDINVRCISELTFLFISKSHFGVVDTQQTDRELIDQLKQNNYSVE